MLGWSLIVYRQADGGTKPADLNSQTGERIATWTAGPNGIEWLDSLTSKGKAISLGGNGFPSRYTAKTSAIAPALAKGAPYDIDEWLDETNTTGNDSPSKKSDLYNELVDQCGPEEWLIIEAWDEG